MTATVEVLRSRGRVGGSHHAQHASVGTADAQDDFWRALGDAVQGRTGLAAHGAGPQHLEAHGRVETDRAIQV